MMKKRIELGEKKSSKTKIETKDENKLANSYLKSLIAQKSEQTDSTQEYINSYMGASKKKKN